MWRSMWRLMFVLALMGLALHTAQARTREEWLKCMSSCNQQKCWRESDGARACVVDPEMTHRCRILCHQRS